MDFNPKKLSPIPIVDLLNLGIPSHGWAIKRNAYCSKKFAQGDACVDFYRQLARGVPRDGLWQCPFGYSCYRFDVAGHPYAFTCFVPFPRQGGDEERARAKDHPEAKIAIAEIIGFARALDSAETSRLDSIVAACKSYPSALHEIRKYNRTIKQEAERLCNAESPGDPDKANPRLVSIFKCSELMTLQFEVLELIANQSLVDLPTNYSSEIYKVFDKCARILQVTADKKPVYLKLEGDSPRAFVNDKTFPIIATVLLENAIKYSTPNSQVIVRIKQHPDDRCTVAVNNLTKHIDVLPRFFEKGARGTDDGTGMGYGLFLAQSVARQHGTEIGFQRVPYSSEFDSYIFSFDLPTRKSTP